MALNREQAAALAAQSSIVAYACLHDHKYQPNRFHRHIAKILEAAVANGHGRIIIQAPPQHGKSRLVSQDFPAWFMGKHPGAPVIAASYGTDLAERNGQEVRERIGSSIHGEIFGKEAMLRADTTAKSHFMTTAGGRYIGATVRGGATGFGARLFVIDDPFKSRAEADSPVVRQQVKDWYQSVVYTRLEDPSILVLMHTRWHVDDLAGWLIKSHPSENWQVVILPALAEENDALGREVGEALLPKRRSAEWLEAAHKAAGERDWLSLYQQRPTNHIGRSEMQAEWFLRHDGIAPEQAYEMFRYIVVDPARTKNTGSDYTAMMVIGLNTDGNRYVLEVLRDKLDLIGRFRELKRLHRAWEPHGVYYKRTAAEADIEAIRMMQSQGPIYRFHITPLDEPRNADGKVGRVRRLIPDLVAGRWWFPKMAWRTNYEGLTTDMMDDIVHQEALPFPFGDHDDGLDCLSGAYDIPEQWPQGTNKTRSNTMHQYVQLSTEVYA